ncbi:MAG TPA: ABC transporter permease, partial [Rectinemataceae bacterium]|nr:ABC transporter permease [Rectinemataceae bacterium]
VVGLLLGLLLAVNINEVFSMAEILVNALSTLANHIAGSISGGDFRIFSPNYFYLMEVPVRVLLPETVFIFCASVASAVVAAASATAQVSKLVPSEVLRYE